MTESVLNFLSCLGYKISGADSELISSILENVTDYVKNYCNIPEIPEQLFSSVTYLTVSQFLKIKKACVLINPDGETVPAIPLDSLKIGDVSFSFSGNSSPEAKLDGFILELEHKGRSDLLCFRRLRW